MTSKRIRWGILGTSFISEKMASAIQASTISELLAIASRSTVTAKKFAEKFSIPQYHDNYEALLNNPDIDAIYIGLPNHVHKDWIIRCALAGKHILCEKPFVISVQEALEVMAVVKKLPLVCMEALMYRCHPFTKKLQEVVQSGVIGDIKLFNATYTANIATVANKTAGGSIRNLGCYPVSLVRLLANAEPMQMKALSRMGNNHHDHQASTILKFANDAMAVISTADDVEMFWQFEVCGSRGMLKVLSNPWLPDYSNKLLIQHNDSDMLEEIIVTADKPLYTYQIDTVSECILNQNFNSEECISLQDSLNNTKILETWRQQIQRQIPVLENY